MTQMKKWLISSVFAAGMLMAPCAASAAGNGYVNYPAVLQAMPAFSQAQQEMVSAQQTLQKQFNDQSKNMNDKQKKELAAKLPKRFLTGGKNKKAWLADQKEFQKLKRTIKLANPKKKNEISVKTKEISGYAFPEAYVELKNLKTGKTTKCVKADKNGYFKLKKLNLKKWGGAKVQVNLYKYSKEQKRNVQVVCNTVLKVKKK